MLNMEEEQLNIYSANRFIKRLANTYMALRQVLLSQRQFQ
jgi:hypothetical protein